MLTKRTQILFDKDLWRSLVNIAKKENTSVGELVRTAVKKEYGGRMADIENIVEEIRKFRDTYGKKLAKGEDSTQIIRKMREERYGTSHLRRLSHH